VLELILGGARSGKSGLAENRALDSGKALIYIATAEVGDEEMDEYWQRERYALFDVIENLPGDVILVSNEVGQGIVPLGELSRNFVDQSGWLHQDLAQVSDSVIFVVAGLAQCLKSPSN
jgi:adenosyl cobinamide kinase/adenosyl cobinamide phosphate guanylyltransferase